MNLMQIVAKKRLQKAIRKSKMICLKKSILISEWCRAYGNLDRYEWIIREILKAVKEDEKFQEYIYLNEELEISLDENGIFIFSEILISFFGEKEVMEKHRFLRNENLLVSNVYEPMNNLISDAELSDEEFLKIYHNWNKWFENNRQTLNELDDENRNILTLTFENINKELKRRKL